MSRKQKPVPRTQSPATYYPRQGMTLDEIADAFNVTRERIRQIENNALRKLRIELRRRGLRPEDVLPDIQRGE